MEVELFERVMWKPHKILSSIFFFSSISGDSDTG